MNKIIIIVLLVVVTVPSMAKTKVYGELHASYDKIFINGENSRDDIALNNTTIGIKGSTEIKKDISFIHQFAWGVSSHGFEDKSVENGVFRGMSFADTSNPSLNNRNQAIGLASLYGAMLIGRFDTPFKTFGRKADLFWSSQLGQNRNISNAGSWDVRADKIIIFQTPKINNFQGSVAYASDIASTSRFTRDGSAISANGFYSRTKFSLGVAYEQHDLDESSTKSSVNTKALRLSANYKNGPWKLVGFYQKENNGFVITSEPDATVIGSGLSYRKGKGTLKTQIYIRDIDSTSKNTRLFAIGYDYQLSKKLDIYMQAVKIDNGTNLGGYYFGKSNVTINDAHGVSFGVKYTF